MAINDYCETTDLMDALVDSGLSDTDVTGYDAILASCISRASRMIDKKCKRAPGAFAVDTDAAEVRYYTGSGHSQQWIDEMCAAPSAVGMSLSAGVQSSDYTSISSSDYFCWPDNAAGNGRPYRRLDLDTLNGAYSSWYRFPRSIKVTGAFGYSYKGSTPEDIVQATIGLAARIYKRGLQGYADVSGSADVAVTRTNAAFDKDTEAILANYGKLTI